MRRGVLEILRDGRLGFHCPGCGCMHAVDPKRWSFDGNFERPTFSPSINNWTENSRGEVIRRCHSFVESGSIRFLSDCTHELSGRTVPLEALDG